MPQPLSGPNIGLPLPTYLYPSELLNAPYDTSTNILALEPGEAVTVPAGNWYINAGDVSFIQYLNPITTGWTSVESSRGQLQYVKSDGFTCRVANLTGCMAAAIVVAGGAGYTQATAAVTASAGNSTWQPIVGGQCSVVSVTTTGANYRVAPLVFIPAPPAPGVPATAVATLSAGTVASVSLTNVGAGYQSAPPALILPSPFETATNITTASVTIGLTSSGSIAAVICTNQGSPVTSLPTLTAAGGSTAASIVAVQCLTLTSVVIVGAGTGLGATAEVSTVGGRPAGTPQWVNPAVELNLYRPRKASVGMTSTGGTLAAFGAIYDSGLFMGTPTAVIQAGSGGAATAASVTLSLGSANDTIILQPAP